MRRWIREFYLSLIFVVGDCRTVLEARAKFGEFTRTDLASGGDRPRPWGPVDGACC